MPCDSLRIDDLRLDDRVDVVCDQFERDWSPDKVVDFLAYLRDFAPIDQGRLFVELLLVDRELHGRRQTTPSWEEYAARYPQFAHHIEAAAFANLAREASIEVADQTAIEATKALGRFQLIEPIGSGAAGDVWKAFDPRLHRIVAIKVPRRNDLTDDEIERFLREGRAAAQLDHPGIVPIYEVARQGDKAFLVSAFVEGGDLRAHLLKTRITWFQAAEICRDVAEALHHAHENGIIHRDLKPANVLIDRSGHPRVADFGLAKWADDERLVTIDGELLGTPAYMSPEQARGEARQVDRRSDVYSLGALFYELVTGHPPFSGDCAAITYQLLHNEPRRPRSLDRQIPRDLETICLKAMEKRPCDRYSTACDMAADLRRYLQGESILARRPSLWERAARLARRRPAAAFALLLAFTTTAAMLIAGNLAQENRNLLGLRTVRLSTNPPGARLAVAQIDSATGDPIPEKITHLPGVSPISAELVAGDYLVVAVLSDGSGTQRFHEVYRHVPKSDSEIAGIFSHNRWHVDQDKVVQLPTIAIPDSVDSSRMASIEVEPGSKSQTIPFLMDCFEFTVQDYHSTYGEFPKDTRWQRVPPTHAVCVPYDRALAIAERIGKRLPSEAEFERAAKHCRPIETVSDVTTTIAMSFGPVGSPAHDCTATFPAIVGLRSNVAEWTTSGIARLRNGEVDMLTAAAVSLDSRIVRGGSINVVDGVLTAAHDDPVSTRVAMPRGALKPGLGFRCVRSATPRFFTRPGTTN